MRIRILLLLSAFFLQACATDPFSGIKVSDVTIEQAAASPKTYSGRLVRWGGTILNIENRKNHTIVEVLGKPLGSFAEPDDRKVSTGRFMARIPGFLDPAEYREPNRLTVVGTLAGIRKGKVGGYTYSYPLVEVQQRKLWKGGYEVAEPVYYPAWWYGPAYHSDWPYWYNRPYRPRPPAPRPRPPQQPPGPSQPWQNR